jgi:ankyrin repeat protein
MTYFDLKKQLKSAIDGGAFAEAATLIGAGGDPNALIGERGDRVLAHAIRHGAPLAFCQYLIDRGSDVVPTDPTSQYPLRVAVEVGNSEICRELIKRGADVNHRTEFYGGALQAAVFDGNVALCRLLIEHGADVEAENARGRVPLHLVDIVFGDDPATSIDIARLLVQHGASPSYQPANANKRYLTPFQQALRNGNAALADFFIHEAGQDATQVTLAGKSMVHVALTENAQAVIRAAVTEKEVAQSMDAPSPAADPAQNPQARAPSPL